MLMTHTTTSHTGIFFSPSLADVVSIQELTDSLLSSCVLCIFYVKNELFFLLLVVHVVVVVVVLGTPSIRLLLTISYFPIFILTVKPNLLNLNKCFRFIFVIL